jgi:hypothetical protein
MSHEPDLQEIDTGGAAVLGAVETTGFSAS